MGNAFAHKTRPQAFAQDRGHAPSSLPAKPDRLVHDVLHSPGKPLDSEIRADMEPRFRHDFSKVRIHADDRAAKAASSIDAHAFTSNHNIVFGPGEFAPHMKSGRRLLAHELTHVVQQQAGVHLQDGIGRAGDIYEAHADTVADFVVDRKPAGPLLDAYRPAATLDRAIGATVQRQGFGHDSGGAPAVSTYVARPKQIEYLLREKKKLEPGLFSKFVRMLESLDRSLQGHAKQSWGIMIWGAGDGRGSTAAEATKDAKIIGDFDFKGFMEIIELILGVFPENTSYRALHDNLEKRDVDELLPHVFEALKRAKKQQAELDNSESEQQKKTSLADAPQHQDETANGAPAKNIEKPSPTTGTASTHQKVELGQWVWYDNSGNMYLMIKYSDGSKRFIFASIFGSKDISDPGPVEWRQVRWAPHRLRT